MLLKELISYSISQRKLIWDLSEIYELFVSADGLVKNLTIGSSFSVRFVAQKVISKIKRKDKFREVNIQDTDTFINRLMLDKDYVEALKKSE